MNLKTGMIIHCRTEEESKQLFEALIAEGYTWYSGRELDEWDTDFEYYGKNTCYRIDSIITKKITYGKLETYQNLYQHSSIIPFTVLKDIISKKERLIDANEFLKMPLVNGEYDKKNANEDFIFGIETAREMVEGMPNAFDLDSFIDELVSEIRVIPHERDGSHSPYIDGQEDACNRILIKLEELVNKHKEQRLGHCLNCGESFYGEVKKDGLGSHMECAGCGASFDIEDDREL